MQVSTIGLDLAKHVFQVHGVDREGNVVLRKRLRRGELEGFLRGLPPCLVGMEACGTAHHWARLIRSFGHEVRLLPPSYVKPYVKRGKTDAADAEAICEAVTRPTMRQVPVKSAEQQAALMLHRVRDLLVRQRTMLLNAMRGHMAEFGIVVPQGSRRVGELVALVVGENDAALPALARQALRELAAALGALDGRIEQAEAAILAWHKGSQADGLLPSPVSARSPHPQSSPPSEMRASSNQHGTSQPGSGWSRNRIVPAASSGREAFPSRETGICVDS